MPQRVADTGVLTAANLTIIAVLAIITILGILWGIRLKRRRNEAERIEGERVEAESGEEPRPSSLAPASSATVAPPPAAAVPRRDGGPKDAPALQPSLTDELAAAVPLDASLASKAATEPTAASAETERPVTDIKGLGPKVATRLAELGVTHVAQIAALDAGEAERLDAELGPFTGRMARDRWVEQARFLAAGDVKGFEAVFGRL